jgi:hypothetical protein
MKVTAFLTFLFMPLLVLPVESQNVNPAHPEEMQVQKHMSPDDIRARAANLQFQKDAKELSELCSSIPADMDGLRQGVLSKETIDKLKRIEKLSKRVREQLMP